MSEKSEGGHNRVLIHSALELCGLPLHKRKARDVTRKKKRKHGSSSVCLPSPSLRVRPSGRFFSFSLIPPTARTTHAYNFHILSISKKQKST